MSKHEEKAVVLEQRCIGDGIYDLVLSSPEIAADARAGQFVSVYTNNPSKLLPRPISLCGFDSAAGTIRLVYRVTGENTGTEEFSGLKAGEQIRLLGPLGNGFSVEQGKKALIVGGGIGVPPMLQLAREMKENGLAPFETVLGYRDGNTFLLDEFEALGSVSISSDNGTVGLKGTVVDAIRENGLRADVIYACGPKPMLRALAGYAEEHGIVCYVSMEERMACGIGACLACVCQSKEVDSHSQVHNKRVCADGPVFRADEIDLSQR